VQVADGGSRPPYVQLRRKGQSKIMAPRCFRWVNGFLSPSWGKLDFGYFRANGPQVISPGRRPGLTFVIGRGLKGRSLMAQSLANVLLHVVWSTKNREPWINDEVRPRFHGYIVGVFENLDCPSLETNSESDHVHVLCRLSRTRAIAKLIEQAKTSTSAWFKGLEGRELALLLARRLRGFFSQRISG
jgi:REP element-mobilizing transposase RayT